MRRLFIPPGLLLRRLGMLSGGAAVPPQPAGARSQAARHSAIRFFSRTPLIYFMAKTSAKRALISSYLILLFAQRQKKGHSRGNGPFFTYCPSRWVPGG